MSSVAVIDYGMGNLHSIVKALQHADPQTVVICTADAEAILDADRVVFPGVGAIRDCMHALHATGLAAVIRQAAASKPLLGICLGMQALLTDSEENGGVLGLNLIPGHVVRFADNLSDTQGNVLKIPHMGWNQVRWSEEHAEWWRGLPNPAHLYFVHSYYPDVANGSEALCHTDYGVTFAAGIARKNLMAVQFHPEKSQELGLLLLKNAVQILADRI